MGTEPPGIEWRGVCLDCVDAEKMATFYGRLLGWPFTGRDTPEDRKGGTGWVGMKDPEGGVGLSFQAEEWYQPPTWPEEEELQAKMMHLEMSVHDLDTAIAEVVASGGRIAPHQPPDRDQARARVMLDPAGHPFCLYSE
ncbi:MAG TPA: VOC family protein [Acidimicrobiales bacterium]|nr:VOC family protein [Acidimicrobiales bacterium]